MAVRAATLIRVSIVVGAALVAAAGWIRPFEKTAPPRRVRPAPAATAAAPAPPPVRVTPSGLLGVGAETLLARVRASGASGAPGAAGVKGILVNAWASWCGSCKGDIPLLLRLPKTFGSRIEVIFVSVDEPDSQPAAMEMLLSLQVPLPSYVVDEPLDVFKVGINPRWPGMLPATFLFDGTGKLRYYWGGPVLEPDVVPLLRRYFAGEHIDGEANFALSPGAVTR